MSIEQKVTRKLRAILSADVKGYSLCSWQMMRHTRSGHSRNNMIRSISILLDLIFFTVIFYHICYASPTRVQEINPSIDSYNIGNVGYFLEDKYRKYSIDQISSAEFSDKFRPTNSDTINFGLTSSAFWFRFSIVKVTNENHTKRVDKNWVVHIGSQFWENIDFYIPMTSTSTKNTGREKTPNKFKAKELQIFKHIGGKPFVYILPEELSMPETFYLRLTHGGTLSFKPMVYALDTYILKEKQKRIWFGTYYGFLLSLILINLYVYFVFKDINYFYYICYLTSSMCFFLFINGSIKELFPTRVHQNLNLIALLFVIFWGSYLARSFLLTKKSVPKIDKLLITVKALALILICLTPFISYLIMNQIISIFGLFFPIIILGAAFYSYIQGFQPARLFILAWLFMLIGGLIFAATYRGIVPYTILTINSFQIGSGIEALVLSFALADRFRTLRREKATVMQAFGKYVTKDIRDQILQNRIPLDGETKEVTVLFADLRDFTTLAESNSPKEVVNIINAYFREMAHAIRQNHGLVLQYIGDEIEAVFGAPLPLENHPTHAVRAALAMREGIKSVNDQLINQGYDRLRHGIGIHTGTVVAANIGSDDRLSYALVGDTVNIASRIQGLNKKFCTDILISATTMQILNRNIKTDKLQKVTVKGKKNPVEIFKVN